MGGFKEAIQKTLTLGKKKGKVTAETQAIGETQPQAPPQGPGPEKIPQTDGTGTEHPPNHLRTNELLGQVQQHLTNGHSNVSEATLNNPSDGPADSLSRCDGNCNCPECPRLVTTGISQAPEEIEHIEHSAVNGNTTVNSQSAVIEGTSPQRSASNTAIRNGVGNENAVSSANNNNQNGNGEAVNGKADIPNNTQTEGGTGLGLRQRFQNRLSNTPLGELISRRWSTRSEDAAAPNGTPADSTLTNSAAANSTRNNSILANRAPVNSIPFDSPLPNSAPANLAEVNFVASATSASSDCPDHNASIPSERPQTSHSNTPFLIRASQAPTNINSQPPVLPQINTDASIAPPNAHRDPVSRYLPLFPSHAVVIPLHAYGSSLQSTEPYAGPVSHAYGSQPGPVIGISRLLPVAQSERSAGARPTIPSLDPHADMVTAAVLDELRNTAMNAARLLSESSNLVTDSANTGADAETVSPVSSEDSGCFTLPEPSLSATAPVNTAGPQPGPGPSDPVTTSTNTSDSSDTISPPSSRNLGLRDLFAPPRTSSSNRAETVGRGRSDSVLTGVRNLFQSPERPSEPATPPVNANSATANFSQPSQNTAYDNEFPSLPRPQPGSTRNGPFNLQTNMRAPSAGTSGGPWNR